ncbi:hypothetical protein V6Z11_A11G381300 [Gossypium hirsutum]
MWDIANIQQKHPKKAVTRHSLAPISTAQNLPVYQFNYPLQFPSTLQTNNITKKKKICYPNSPKYTKVPYIAESPPLTIAFNITTFKTSPNIQEDQNCYVAPSIKLMSN